MPNLAKGVGWEPPKASVPAKHLVASQPGDGPLTSTKKRRTEAKADVPATQPIPSLDPSTKDLEFDQVLGRRYETMPSDTLRVRWLLSALKTRGDRTDYKSQPHLCNPAYLEMVWNTKHSKTHKVDADMPTKQQARGNINIGSADTMDCGKGANLTQPPAPKPIHNTGKSTTTQTLDWNQLRSGKTTAPLVPPKPPKPPKLLKPQAPLSLSNTTQKPKPKAFFTRKQVDALREKQAQLEEAAENRDSSETNPRSPAPLAPSNPQSHPPASSKHKRYASTPPVEDGSSSLPPVQALFGQLIDDDDEIEDDQEDVQDEQVPPVEVGATHRAKRKEAQERQFGVARPLVRWVVVMVRVRMITVLSQPSFLRVFTFCSGYGGVYVGS
ncbi:hypothetical protein RhiJN_07318 [Ceratobasidium sp. AG-Ba]|nr:hypothetical protein RhiJN_07318 [Ceratobasidium sp. AG-Ba]